MAVIPAQWLDCVVALGEETNKENDAGSRSGGRDAEAIHWMATGFFYVHVNERIGTRVRGKAYLVTARHVVAGRTHLSIRVNPSAAEPAQTFGADLENAEGKPLWLHHDDDEIDIAVLPVDLELLRRRGMRTGVFFSDTDIASRHQLLERGVSEGDDVFILGFPMGDVGGARSYVIVRGGTIARIRDALAGHSDDLLLDCFVFPGNSGGPVILRAGSGDGERPALLLGLVKSYVSYQDVAVSQQTKRPRVVFEENTGLATAHPVDLVAELARRHAESEPTDEAVADHDQPDHDHPDHDPPGRQHS